MRDSPSGGVRLNRTQRVLTAVTVAGGLVIAGIGFAGSYDAVRELAIEKGFGSFAYVFPIGVDAGITVLLALDLLLTWLRMPFPLLRQAAWLLTVSTIGFNAAAAWPDPVAVGMHAVIPVLFVVTVEAARHAVGRMAAITADRHMEGVRLWRWILAPASTFVLWRRMKLWEIRRYDEVIRAEQDRLVYQARLRMRFGRRWRWRAPVEDLLPLHVARYGVPLRDGLAAADELASASRPLPDPQARGRAAAGGAAARHGSKPGPGGRAPTAAPVAVPEGAGSDVGAAEQPAPMPSRTAAEAAAPPSGAVAAASGAPSAKLTPRSGGQSDRARRNGRSGKESTGRPAQDAVEPGLAGQPPQASADPDIPQPDAGVPEHRGEGAPTSGIVSDEPDAWSFERGADEHRAALALLTSKAGAVRYAMEVLDSTSTPEVVDWLKRHGQSVNRGQAHRLTEAAAARRRKPRT